MHGFLAYDISLIDKDGNEKEPDGNVNISFEYINIPSDFKKIQNSEVSVVHFENENKKINLKQYTLDAKKDSEKLKIEKNKSNEIKKLEFETDSFSTFTITWTEYGRIYANLNFHYVNSHGKEITGNRTRTIYVKTGDELEISDYVENEINYQNNLFEYQSAHIDKIGGTEITKMTFDIGKNAVIENGRNDYNVTFYNGNTEVANLDYDSTSNENNKTRTIDIYLVYVYKVNNVSITDTIMQNGCLNAVLKDKAGNNIKDKSNYIFKWYKTRENSNGKPTNWQEIDQMVAGGEYIISEDGSSINVSLDQGSNTYYKVDVLNDEIGTISSEEYLVPYFEDVQNGGFEKPKVGDDYDYIQVKNGTKDLIWKTTGTNNGKDVEILTQNGKNMKTLYNIEEVKEGSQCAELNCEASGALYQDVLTIPGQNLTWSLAHRARDKDGNVGTRNKDSMYVIIMSTQMAELYDVTTQAKVNYIINHSTKQEGDDFVYDFKGHNIYIQKISDDNRAWKEYMGNFTIPNSQYLTRFFFVAGDTASGNSTVGNFLDDVHVGQNINKKLPGYVTVNVTKIVKGVPKNNAFTGYNIKIDNNNSGKIKDLSKTISSSAYKWDDNENGWTQTVQYIIDLKDAENVKSIFTESNYTNFEGCTYIKSEYQFENNPVVINENYQDKTSFSTSELDLRSDETYSLKFTNTYEENVTSVTVQKLGKILNSDQEFTKELEGAVFTLKDSNNNIITSDPTNQDGITVISGLHYNTIYKLEEIIAPKGYYTLNENVYIKVNEDSSVKITNSDGEEQHFDYVKLNENDIQITDIPHTVMPKAGGIGTKIFDILGITIIILSVFGIIKKNRKN